VTVTYPQSTKAKRQKPLPPPVAPTAALRADAALADALRFSGSAVAQVFAGAMWAVMLSSLISSEGRLGVWGVIGSVSLIFPLMAVFAWASMQGQGFGTQRYSSGQSSRIKGAAKYTLFAGFAVMAVGLAVPVVMYLAWQRNEQLPTLTSVMQLCVVLWQLLFSASLSLRAVQAIKFAREQLGGSDLVGTAMLDEFSSKDQVL
jgi:hypothetical protein